MRQGFDGLSRLSLMGLCVCLAVVLLGGCGDGKDNKSKGSDSEVSSADSSSGSDGAGSDTGSDVVIPVGEPGALDPSFSEDGKLTAGDGQSDERGRAISVQADGKILVAGKSNDDFILMRFLADGTPDTSFDGDGVVGTDLKTAYDEGKSIAVQADNKILLAGITTRDGDADFGLVRYTPEGALDLTFSEDGKTAAPIGAGADEGKALILQADGKPVMVGQSHNGSHNDFALARFDANGALDPTFGTGGIVTADLAGGLNDEGNAIRQQADGKLVVAGYASVGSNDNQDFVIARFDTNGALDPTFGTGGSTKTAIGAGNDIAFSLAIQADGKLIIAGLSTDGARTLFAAARYTADGFLDTTFGTEGMIKTPIGTSNDASTGCAIDASGRLLLAGTTDNGTDTDFALVRYTADGLLDTTFGTGGLVTTAFSGIDGAYAMTLQPDNKILVAGETKSGSNTDFAVARFLSE